MRARLLRTTSVQLSAVLIGLAIGAPARADDAGLSSAASASASLGSSDTRSVDEALAPPDLPAAGVDVSDVTGSVKSSPTTGTTPTPPGSAVPAALSFDEQPKPTSATAPAAPTVGSRGNDDATASVGPPLTQSIEPGPAPSSPVATPAQAPSPLAAVAPPAFAAPAIAAALTSFADARVAADTPAQAGERHKTRAAIADFYAAHADAALWIVDGHLSPAGRSVLARLDHAAEDGLDLGRFVVPVPRSADPSTLTQAELALSEASVAYARQASGSRVDVAHLGGIIDLRPDVAAVDRILGSVPTASDAGEALQAFNPPQAGYAALKEKLAELRQTDMPEARTRIPGGPVLRPGMLDARVPLIRARFGLDVASVDPGVPPLVYDTRVAAAVADFQRAHGLPASGQLTPRTVAALSGGNPVSLENAIVANMELWRWLPRDLGPDHVEVNIPDYKAKVVRDGAVMHETRVVVGQPDKPTPVFAQQMRFIIVNPYWNVPLSIIKNEMLPKLQSDPDYFADHGYEVVERDGVRTVRQPPGDGNALGRIKFMFPNEHAVYLHDTNARSFFGRDKRALSHGCVRVEEPFSFAEAVMGRDNGWTEARIRKLIGGQERTINLPKPLPIYITYFTAFVDPQTGFQLRDDVYGYAGKVKTALGLQG